MTVRTRMRATSVLAIRITTGLLDKGVSPEKVAEMAGYKVEVLYALLRRLGSNRLKRRHLMLPPRYERRVRHAFADDANTERIAKQVVVGIVGCLQASGVSFVTIARIANVEYQSFYFWLPRWGEYDPRRHRRISPETYAAIQRDLMETECTRRAIARRHGVSKGSVDLHAARLMRRELSEVSDEVAFAPKPHQCEVHGPVRLTPCPMCVAVEAKRLSKN